MGGSGREREKAGLGGRQDSWLENTAENLRAWGFTFLFFPSPKGDRQGKVGPDPWKWGSDNGLTEQRL